MEHRFNHRPTGSRRIVTGGCCCCRTCRHSLAGWGRYTVDELVMMMVMDVVHRLNPLMLQRRLVHLHPGSGCRRTSWCGQRENGLLRLTRHGRSTTDGTGRTRRDAAVERPTGGHCDRIACRRCYYGDGGRCGRLRHYDTTGGSNADSTRWFRGHLYLDAPMLLHRATDRIVRRMCYRRRRCSRSRCQWWRVAE